MHRVAGPLLVVASLLAAATVGAGGAQKEKQKQTPEGTWVVVAMEQDGMKLPADAVEKLAIKLTIKGDDYVVTFDGETVDKGTCKADMQKKPCTIDIKSEEGPNKGKTMLAIAEVDGDNMKVCYDMLGKGRPMQFATLKDSGQTLIVYKREAKK